MVTRSSTATDDATRSDSPEDWTREERRRRMLEVLEASDDLRERILARRGKLLPAGWTTRAVKADRP
ncbi:MAG: hypothetical protein GF393_03395 [Armatimonadia bacterium]|nr:hypothetical protein [Armatimonadia bacterium]